MFRNYIKSIITEIITDFHSDLKCSYTLYENGSIIDRIEIIQKPSRGDIIINKKEINSFSDYRFEITRVEISKTGYTGNLYGRVLDKL